MEIGIAIVTAQGADAKVLNRFLLSIRNWEDGKEGIWDNFVVARTLDEMRSDSITRPPVQEFFGNDFENLPLATIEGFMMAAQQSLFLVLDDRGVQEETVILVQRAINEGPGKLYKNYFNKFRVPWIQAYSPWVNVKIGNMGFQEFCAEPYDYEGDWWTYSTYVRDEELARTDLSRFAAIKELEKLDLA